MDSSRTAGEGTGKDSEAGSPDPEKVRRSLVARSLELRMGLRVGFSFKVFRWSERSSLKSDGVTGGLIPSRQSSVSSHVTTPYH